MKKWFLHQKFVISAKFRKLVARKKICYYCKDQSSQLSLEDYTDRQISRLLAASKAYRQAKKNPDKFVENYFSRELAPIHSYSDSWLEDDFFPEGKVKVEKY